MAGRGGRGLMNTTLSGRHRSPWKTSVVAQSCVTLCNHMDCNPPGSSVHGIFQARRPPYIPTEGKSLLCKKWVAISFSRGSSRCRDRTCVSLVSCIGRWILYHERHLGYILPKRQLITYAPDLGACLVHVSPEPLAGKCQGSQGTEEETEAREAC